MSTVEAGNLYPRAESAHQGDTWRTIGKHPLLELKHTVEDRLLVATHINFLGLRAMFHRNEDTAVLFSDTIDEPKTQGNAVGKSPLSRPPDRLMILTDKHLYVAGSPSSAIFAPAASGACYKLSEFSRMAVINNANSAVIQFVGGIVGARFSSKKDCERCAIAVYTATGIPTENLSIEELDVLHQRRSFGSSTKMSRFVAQTVRDALETASVAGSDASTSLTAGSGAMTNKKRILRNDNGAVTNTFDNMLKFVVDGESELAEYDSGFPEVGIQASCQTEDASVDAKPETVDAATSPIDPSLFGAGGGAGGGDYRYSAIGGLNTRNYARRFGDRDSDDDGADVGENLWTSLKHGPRRGPSASAAIGGAGGGGTTSFYAGGVGGRAGGNSRLHQHQHHDPDGSDVNFSFANDSMINTVSNQQQQQQQKPKSPIGSNAPMSRMASLDLNISPSAGKQLANTGGGNFEGGASAAAFDSWLGVLAAYRPAMEERGITSVNRLMRIPPGPEWEAFLDEIGVTRAGHRVLLTTKVSAQRK